MPKRQDLVRNSVTKDPPVLRLSQVPEPARYIMLIETREQYSDMGIWGFPDGFFVHPTKFMQVMYCDGHAKATKFSRTLGTNNDDQEWTFLQNRYADVNAARKRLQTPSVWAKME